MCLLKLSTSLVDRSLLTRFHKEMMLCFTIEQLYQWRFVTVYYQHFPPDQPTVNQEGIRLKQQGMLAVTHIQTLKVVSYK